MCCLFTPFALFSHDRIGKSMREFVFAYGAVGFLPSLILPIPALQIYPMFHFRSMQSMLYHTALGFVAFLQVTKKGDPMRAAQCDPFIGVGLLVVFLAGCFV